MAFSIGLDYFHGDVHCFSGHGKPTLNLYDFRPCYLFFWIIIAFTYPKTVLIGDDSIAFQLPGSDKIQAYKYNELELSRNKGYYELAVSGTKRRKKFWTSTKGIPAGLEEVLEGKLL